MRALCKSTAARGVVLAMLGRNSESESTFRTAIELDGELFEPHFNFGKLLLEMKRPLEAKTELRRATELNSRHLPSIELFVDSMLATHDEASAATFLEEIDKRQVDHPVSLHLEVATAMQQDGALIPAADQYKVVLRHSPSPSERSQAELALWRIGVHD